MLTVLVAGDTVYALSDPEIAAEQYKVLIGSNLDVDRYRVTPEKWAEGKAVAIEDGMETVEVVCCGHCRELIEHEAGTGWVLRERDGTYDLCDESEEGHAP